MKNLLTKANIKKMFREAEQASFEKIVVRGKQSYTWEKSFKQDIQNDAMPVLTTVLKLELKNLIDRAIADFKKVME